MTDLEKQIEEAAEAEYSTRSGLLSDREHYILCSAYVTGAKSPEAKAFHQQGMYENELLIILSEFYFEIKEKCITFDKDTLLLFINKFIENYGHR